MKYKKPFIGISTDLKGNFIKLKKAYVEAVKSCGGEPLLLVPSCDIEQLVNLIDGLLISGGHDLDPSYYGEKPITNLKIVSQQRSEFEFKILRKFINKHKPILGICYGMQLINVAFGGSLYQDINLQLPLKYNHNKGYHKILIKGINIFKNGCFSVNSSHHQAIKDVGKNISIFAYSYDNLIEGIYKRGYPFLIGVQWHPERMMNNELSIMIFREFIKKAYECK